LEVDASNEESEQVESGKKKTVDEVHSDDNNPKEKDEKADNVKNTNKDVSCSVSDKMSEQVVNDCES
jgi:hypothetical protein